MTSRNAGAHCYVCPSRPRLHQSHLATALGLPACNFMAQKYNVSFFQHSLLMLRHPACILLFFSAMYEYVAQYIYSILICRICNPSCYWQKHSLRQGRKMFLEDKIEMNGSCESLFGLFGETFQRWWSWYYRMLSYSKLGMPLLPLALSSNVQTTNDKSPARTLLL